MPEEKKFSADVTEDKNKFVDHGKLIFHWHFPEYVQYRRSRSWYVAIIIFLLVLFCCALLTANFLFALFLILFGLVLFLQLRHSPLEVEFKIFEDGISIGERFHEWSGIKKFHIVYRPPETKRLYFDLKNTFFSDFSVPLEDQNPLEIRRVLKKYLLEDLDKESESLADWLSRRLKI